MGYILAFISSIFFSLYVIPRKLSKQPALFFSLLMGTGFFASSVILYLFKPIIGFSEKLSLVLLWSVLAGALWALGFVLFIKSIDCIGLSRSNQWKNLQGPVAVVLSLIILGEYAKTNPIFAILAGLAILLSAIAFTIFDSKSESKKNSKGLYLAILSGLFWGSEAVINKYVTVNNGVYLQQVVWSGSIMLSILIYVVLFYKNALNEFKKIDRRNILLGLSAGVLYLGASFFMLQSYKYIPASIGFTIIQLNTIWTVSAGIFIFHEIDGKKYYKRILLGFLFALLGIILLVLAVK